MAKKSAVARDLKRQKMILKYAAKRAELKSLGDQEGLAKLPKNSSPTRWKNRCLETGRPHAYMRQFGLNRISFREHASKGEIQVLRKRVGKNMSTQTDPIADMLSRIRNAIAVRKHEITLPHSTVKQAVAQLLVDTGYISGLRVTDATIGKTLALTLTDGFSNSPITEIKRISTPGRRYYAKAAEIPTVKRGRGVVLVSTSKGIMTGREAKQQKLGGELICSVY